MTRFRERVYATLSGKRAATIIVLCCIVAKSVLISYYSYVGKDKIYSLSASYNLLHGKGWTNSFHYPDDLQKEWLSPFCFWPPGYGILITPLQAVFGSDIFLSTTIFEIICFVIFILLCRSILKTQNVHRAWLNISTIVLAFVSHEFVETSLGTDLPALCFMLGFFYCSLRLWKEDRTRKIIRHGILAGLCLFFAGFIRYMYVPVCLFTAVMVLVVSYWQNNKDATRGYWLAFGISVVLLVAAMLFQGNACGSPFYTGIEEKGVFMKNIRYWYPSAIAAFVNVNLVSVQLGKRTGISYLDWQYVFSWLNLLVYAVIAVVAVKYFYRVRNIGKAHFPVFAFFGFAISASIIGGLALLSLTHQEKPTSGGMWTFIVEGRYQAFPVVFAQLFFLERLSRIESIRRRTRWNILAISLCGLLFLNIIHQVYYTIKVATHYSSMKRDVVREQDYVFVEGLLRSVENRQVVVASSDRYYPLLASMLGQKGVFDVFALDSIDIKVQQPSTLFTVIFEAQKPFLTKYLQRKDVTLVREVAGTSIYQQRIDP